MLRDWLEEGSLIASDYLLLEATKGITIQVGRIDNSSSDRKEIYACKEMMRMLTLIEANYFIT